MLKVSVCDFIFYFYLVVRHVSLNLRSVFGMK